MAGTDGGLLANHWRRFVAIQQYIYLLFYVDNHESVGGIMVSIAAFQAVDPGSIPGRRSFLFMPILFNFIVFSNTQNFLHFSEHGVVWS